ncbi:MAG: hypothetical protein AAF732_01585 [Pseudomonadota bacterium]
MAEIDALNAAIGLQTRPEFVSRARQIQLPNGLTFLLRVAAGDDAAVAEAKRRTGQDEASLRRAAQFYIEQVLLDQSADAYRVLGGTPNASAATLRTHMALLLRCFHPDTAGQSSPHVAIDRSVFAERVTRAWERLKTQERRTDYDRERATSRRLDAEKGRRKTHASGKQGGSRKSGKRRDARVQQQAADPSSGHLRRVIAGQATLLRWIVTRLRSDR